jgi:hypothetical protein
MFYQVGTSNQIKTCIFIMVKPKTESREKVFSKFYQVGTCSRLKISNSDNPDKKKTITSDGKQRNQG